MPLALVTNDDGIDSFFLHALVRGLREHFEVAVVAPREEQSWVGRRMTRHGDLHVEPFHGLDGSAWSVNGTPSDCVNLAIGHLLPTPPDVVVSGINFGYNATDTLILCSGTVAGALEGAGWRIPAVAVSKWLPKPVFEKVRATLGHAGDPALEQSVLADGRRSGAFAAGLLGRRESTLLVHNLNFPLVSDDHTPMVPTRPAPLLLGSVFARQAAGHYRFTYAQGEVLEDAPDTDLAVLASGRISYSLLDFSAIGRKPFPA